MECLIVNKKDAQKIKSYLMEKGLYKVGAGVIKSGENIALPLVDMPGELAQNILKKFCGVSFCDVVESKKKAHQSYQEYLKSELTEKEFELLPSSFDVMGNLVIIELKEELLRHEKKIADAILKTHKNITTVLKKSGQHEGEFRTQKLSYIAGINTKETIYKENNVSIMLDVEKVYFSPRLSTERKRIMLQITPGEIVLIMFSGCAPYPCVISKNTSAKEIVGIEKNKIAHEYGLKNIELNKLNNITLINGDVRDVLPALNRKFDRILMPLPKDADTFLDTALLAAKKGTIIHLYDFEHENEVFLGEEKVKKACGQLNKKFEILKTVKCGQYSPGKFRICVDFRIN
ncbi:MAG: class I SAM-dependent methyltransferase family protein [archaeon]